MTTDPTSQHHPLDDLTYDGLTSDLRAHLSLVHARNTDALGWAELEVLHVNDHTPVVPSSAFAAHAGMLDHMAGILEMVKGYKAQCMAAGFEESAAELMAVHLHQAVLFRMGVTSVEVVADGA